MLKNHRARLIEAAVTVGFVLFVGWPWLRPDRHVTLFDTVTYTGPNLEVTNEALRSFSLAQWNDAIFGGIPHLANAQAAVLSPLKVPFVWANTHRAIELMTVANLLMLAAGLFLLFAWRLRLRPPAALVGTVAVVGSGALMARSPQFEQISVLAAVPWVLLTVDWVVTEERRRTVAMGCAALATGFLLVAGHPQQVYIVAPLAATWAVVRMGDARAWRATPRLLVSAALGVGLAAAQLIPMALVVGDSAAVGTRSIADASDPTYSVSSDVFATTVFGDMFETNPVALAAGFEPLVVVGVAVVVLAIIGVVVGLATPVLRWTTSGLLLVAVSAMVLSLGPAIRPYRTAFGHVPGFDLARVPGRWAVLAVFCVAVLAAAGTDAVVRRRVDRPVLVATAGASCFLGVAAVVASTVPSGATALAWGTAVAVVLGAATLAWLRPGWALTAGVVIAALVVVELGSFQRHSIARSNLSPTLFTEWDSEVTELLSESGDRAFIVADEVLTGKGAADGLRPNAHVLYGIRSIDGYDGGTQVTERWADTVSGFGEGDHIVGSPIRNQLTPPLDSDLLADLGVRWIVVELGSEAYGVESLVPDLGESAVTAEGFGIWENPAYESEAVLVGEGVPIRADVSRPGPGDIRVRTDGADESVLVVAEQFADGWSATVDGVATDAFAADDFHIGVPVPPGEHDIRLEYSAPGLRVGLVVSLGSLLALVGLFAWPVVRRSRPDPPSYEATSPTVVATKREISST